MAKVKETVIELPVERVEEYQQVNAPDAFEAMRNYFGSIANDPEKTKSRHGIKFGEWRLLLIHDDYFTKKGMTEADFWNTTSETTKDKEVVDDSK